MTYRTHQATAIAIFSSLTLAAVTLNEKSLFDDWGNPLSLWLTMFADFKNMILNVIGVIPSNDILLFTYTLILISIGSLLPDLDHEKSYISRKLRITGLSWLVSNLKHRGPTHRLDYNVYFFGGISVFIYYFFGGTDGGNPEYSFYTIPLLLGIGSVLHIFGDMHTKSGVKLFGKRSWGLFPKKLRFSTSGGMENLWLVFYLFLSFYSISTLTNIL
jgi:inner membrane protein